MICRFLSSTTSVVSILLKLGQAPDGMVLQTDDSSSSAAGEVLLFKRYTRYPLNRGPLRLELSPTDPVAKMWRITHLPALPGKRKT